MTGAGAGGTRPWRTGEPRIFVWRGRAPPGVRVWILGGCGAFLRRRATTSSGRASPGAPGRVLARADPGRRGEGAAGALRPRAGRGRLRPRGRRRPAAAPLVEPRGPRPRRRAARAGPHPGSRGRPARRRAGRGRHRLRRSPSATTRRTASSTTAASDCFAEQIGDDAGWLHVGRTRREAVRVAVRLTAAPRRARPGRGGGRASAPRRARPQSRHADDVPRRPDLPPARAALDVRPLPALVRLPGRARPAAPARRDRRALRQPRRAWAAPTAAGWATTAARAAQLLGFDRVLEHTRDAMWQTDGLVAARRRRRRAWS